MARLIVRVHLPRPAWLGIVVLAAIIAVACAGGSGGSSLTGTSAGEDGDAGDPTLSGSTPAPEFPAGHTWFNVSEPLSLADLRGKVVLLDFWTSGCINCQQIVPDLNRLEEEFADELVIIGVHSGKYDREQEDQSVRQSLIRYGLRHPVVNDPDFVIWSIYGVNAWPTLILIDPAGNVVGGRAGEGVYPVFQPAIAEVIKEFSDQIDRSPLAIDLEAQGVSASILSFPSAVLADEDGDRLFIADAADTGISLTACFSSDNSGVGTLRRPDGSFINLGISFPGAAQDYTLTYNTQTERATLMRKNDMVSVSLDVAFGIYGPAAVVVGIVTDGPAVIRNFGATGPDIPDFPLVGDPLDPNNPWVDFSMTSSGTGAENSPFMFLAEALAVANPGATISIVPGTDSDEKPTINQNVFLANSNAASGSVSIGVPARSSSAEEAKIGFISKGRSPTR